MSKSVVDVQNLLQNAQDEGMVSQQSVKGLLSIPDIGTQIQAGIGTPPDDVTASEVLCVAMIIDNSGSISTIRDKGRIVGPQIVCEGQNTVIDALSGSKQRDSIQIGTWKINEDDPVHGFVPIDEAVRLVDGNNYWAAGNTPLYHRTLAVLGTLVTKKQFYEDAGLMVRGLLMIVTDGYNESNLATTADDCKTMITDLGEDIAVLFMGVEDQNDPSCDFRQVASEMGIAAPNVYTPKATPSDIRRAFQLASQSALRASQGAAGFSQTRAGGFVSP